MRIRRSIFAGLAALSLAAIATAETRDLKADFDSVVAAERAFSKLSMEKGYKESFLANIAEGGVMFTPEPGPGRDWLNARPDPGIKLVWWPADAGIARSGDLGWTTGPWELQPKAGGEKGYGHFATVWRKQPDGRWKWEVDLGISTPTAGSVGKGPAFPKGKTFDATKTDAEAVKTALLEAERAFAKAVTDKGVLDAYLAILADDALVLREGAHTYRGKKEARAALAKEKSFTWENRGSGVSAAGDLGYTYGMARRGESSAAYMRVWEKGKDGSWKVVLDVGKLQEPPPAQKPAP